MTSSLSKFSDGERAELLQKLNKTEDLAMLWEHATVELVRDALGSTYKNIVGIEPNDREALRHELMNP